MKVSVIIPIYNVRPYLQRCVNSVISQTFKDLEIILVDDGSTDGSGELADELALLDSRIQVIHQENCGPSETRNVGLRAAVGEYVIFLDSDDEWLLSDGLEKLMQNSESRSDLIAFKRVDIWKPGHRNEAADYDLDTLVRFQDASEVFDYLVRTQKLQVSACFLMVRRNVLLENSIYFPKGLINEDISWNLHLWQCVKSVSFQNLPFYGYYHRVESITTSTSIRDYECYDQIFTHWKEKCMGGCVNHVSILSYLATLWVSLGYHLHILKKAERPKAITILKRHKELLHNAVTPKSRRTALMVKTIGVRGTVFILGIYWRLRSKIKGNIV